jgi:HlyD family secretion protein
MSLRKIQPLTFLALFFVTTAWAKTPASQPTAPTSTVQTGSLSISLDFDGTFTPKDAFALRLQTQNYHDDFTVKKAVAPGSKVSKGDVLLELDPVKIDMQLAAAENELTIAQTNLVKAQSDLSLDDEENQLAMTDAQHALSDAKTALKRWDDFDQSAFVKGATMSATSADYEVDNATDELDQLHKMYKSEDLTNQTADIVMKRAEHELELQKIMAWIQHVTADRAVQFEVNIKRAALVSDLGRKTLDVAQLDASQTQKHALAQTSLVSAQQAVDEADQKLDELKNDRQSFTITSPIDGVAVYGSFENNAWREVDPTTLAPGEKVQADQTLITVYAPGKLSLNLQIPEFELLLLPSGSKLRICPEALPGVTYDGITQSNNLIGQTSGSEQSFNLPVELPDADQRLAPGFKANANFDGGNLENILLIPATAVWHGKVWIVTDPSASPQPRYVEIGFSDGEQTQIKSGLKEGDIILTQAKHPDAAAQ